MKEITTLKETLAEVLDAADRSDYEQIQEKMEEVSRSVVGYAEHVAGSYMENGWEGLVSELSDVISRTHEATYPEWAIHDIIDIVDEVEKLEGIFGDEEASKLLHVVFGNTEVLSTTDTV